MTDKGIAKSLPQQILELLFIELAQQKEFDPQILENLRKLGIDGLMDAPSVIDVLKQGKGDETTRT